MVINIALHRIVPPFEFLPFNSPSRCAYWLDLQIGDTNAQN